MPLTREQRCIINRNNAGHSTGPKSPEGKERSKRNALKHGLRAKDVVLPTEDPQEFQEFLDNWMAEHQPATMLRRELVEQAAVASWKLRRCRRLETSRQSSRIDAAIVEYERIEEKKLDNLVANLNSDPRGVTEQLRSTRAGVDRLIQLWDGIMGDAADPADWNTLDTHVVFINLHGYAPADPQVIDLRDISWRLVVTNDPDYAQPSDPPSYTKAEAEEISDVIRAIAARKIDDLNALRRLLPDGIDERNRYAEDEGLMVYEEDVLLDRYSVRLRRELNTSLDQLMKVHKTGIDMAWAVDEAVLPNEATAELVVEPAESEVDGASPDVAPNEAKLETAAPPEESSEPVASEASEPVSSQGTTRRWAVADSEGVNRGPEGTVWSTETVPIDPSDR